MREFSLQFLAQKKLKMIFKRKKIQNFETKSQLRKQYLTGGRRKLYKNL